MDELNQTDNFAKTIFDAGMVAAGTNLVDSIPFVVVPENHRVEDLERLLDKPSRVKAEVIVTEAESFINYVNKHKADTFSMIYADMDSEKNSLSLIAVIDDNGPASNPCWRGHRCIFTPNLSVEWKRWLSRNKQHFSQTDFATWLEDNLPDIAGVEGMPSGADILQMALGFEANAEKRLRSKINLQNGGVQFEFVEDEDKDTRTKMQVFERFTLGLPVFDGSASAYPLEARLKYREKDGKVTFWYELIRPDRVFKTAANDDLGKIKDGTGLPIIFGRP